MDDDFSGFGPSGESAENSNESEGLKKWSPANAVNALKMESDVNGEEDDTKLAKRLAQESAPMAVLSIVHLSQNANNESVRLRAAQYLTDRTLGRIGEQNTDDEDGPIEQLIKDMQALGASESSRTQAK